ncbi:hydrogenase maturation nickel metallochaperone HypA [Streptomyces sp. NPDC002055]|uniref:hydrogenase maturation nickel metallochaperone HypA/HybF n=1 Tax=Streptomyces sp. NPDC002055 TaxID=3154534 RepID=UPI00331DD191
MHELSIALAVVAQVEDAARAHGARRVGSLRVRIGELSGVVPDALAFSFDLAADGTLLEGAELITETVPARARCPVCERETAVGVPPALWCPACGEPLTELLTGRELDIGDVVFHDLDDTGDLGDTGADAPTGAPATGASRAGAEPDDGTPEEAAHVPHR